MVEFIFAFSKLKSSRLQQRRSLTLSTVPTTTGIEAPVYLYLTAKPQRTDQQSKKDNCHYDEPEGRDCSPT